MSEKIVAIYQKFTGGVVEAINATTIPDDCIVEGQNVILEPFSGITTRKGCTNFNSTSYGAYNITRLIEWPRKDGSKVLLAVMGPILAKIAENGNKTDLVTNVYQGELGYFFLQDKFYFAYMKSDELGVSRYCVYDGTTVTDVTPNPAGDNDLAPIKRCRLFIWHSKSFRIFAAKDANDLTCLYYSEPNDPTYFKNTSKLYPTTGDGPVTALALFGDAMLSFYRNSIWAYKGSNPATDATWSKLPSAIGTLSPDSITMAPNKLLFLGNEGLYALSPGILDYNVILVAGEQLIVNIAENKREQAIRDIKYREKSSGIFYDNYYYLAYSYDQADWTKRKILVYNWILKSFTDFVGWNVLSWCTRANGTLLFGTTGGYIRKAFDGYNDNGLSIAVKAKSKKYDLATANYGASRGSITPWHTKKLKRFFLALKTEMTAPTITAKIIGDVAEETGAFTFTATDFFVWGDAWGEKWGWPDMIVGEQKAHLKSKSFQVSVEFETYNDTIILVGCGFEFKAKKKIKGD